MNIEHRSEDFVRGMQCSEDNEAYADRRGPGTVFPFPKPSMLIKHLISTVWQDDNAIILNFFAGSCPSAQAVLEMNRDYRIGARFLLVQLPEPLEAESSAHRAGSATIADVGRERIGRTIKKLKEDEDGKLDLSSGQPLDLGFRVYNLAESTRQPWQESDTNDTKKLSGR